MHREGAITLPTQKLEEKFSDSLSQLYSGIPESCKQEFTELDMFKKVRGFLDEHPQDLSISDIFKTHPHSPHNDEVATKNGTLLFDVKGLDVFNKLRTVTLELKSKPVSEGRDTGGGFGASSPLENERQLDDVLEDWKNTLEDVFNPNPRKYEGLRSNQDTGGGW